mgnify:CR=1 FL=1
MARIAGVDLPKDKRVEIGLTYIYGIGQATSNKLLVEAKPKIQEIMELVHGISEQIRELTPIWVEKFREVRNMLVRKQLESLMSSILFWAINIKVIKRFKKSKLAKFAWKGLTLLQNML